MKEYGYTDDKVKNHFTSYLREFIRSKRWNYLKKKKNIDRIENALKSCEQTGYDIEVEELLEIRQKEQLLFREGQGCYPEWNELLNQELIQALMLLNEEERRLIYQHVFEGRTFEEMACLNEMENKRVKGIYYYAIRKVRKWMGVTDHGI